ncbi:hypothetical protein LTR27_004458 [Elasticomyces elasticus]|nr:hypothetical protein LTR27_004458 [Elasticomyces elasticus]
MVGNTTLAGATSISTNVVSTSGLAFLLRADIDLDDRRIIISLSDAPGPNDEQLVMTARRQLDGVLYTLQGDSIGCSPGSYFASDGPSSRHTREPALVRTRCLGQGQAIPRQDAQRCATHVHHPIPQGSEIHRRAQPDEAANSTHYNTGATRMGTFLRENRKLAGKQLVGSGDRCDRTGSSARVTVDVCTAPITRAEPLYCMLGMLVY